MIELPEEAKNAILGLQKDIENKKQILADIHSLNPDWEQVSPETWPEKEAECWVLGTANVGEENEVGRWLFTKQPPTETEESLATSYYKKWDDHLLIERSGCSEFDTSHLVAPYSTESLREYAIRLVQLEEDNSLSKKRQQRALKSFLQYLRDYIPERQIAFLEHIFPQKMRVHEGRIVRRVRREAYPIPEPAAAAIIKELALQSIEGRNNAQYHAAETLALIWLCLAAARVRLPKQLDTIHAVPKSALQTGSEHPEFVVPTNFGFFPVSISKRVAAFLTAIANTPSLYPRYNIIQTNLKDLRKPLRTAIERAELTASLGPITFTTFLSTPHSFGLNWRYRPKEKTG